MHTINESPICYSLSKSSSDINLQNLLELNVNLNPITIKEHECPNKFNLNTLMSIFALMTMTKKKRNQMNQEKIQEQQQQNQLSAQSHLNAI